MVSRLLLSAVVLLSAQSSTLAKTQIGSPYYSFTTHYGGHHNAHPYGIASPYAGAYVQQQHAHYAPAPVVHHHHAAPVAVEHYAAPAPVVVEKHVAPVAPVAPVVVEKHVAPVAPVVTSSQYHAQDELGSVEYGYSNINSAKQESRDKYGNVAGAYSYVDSTGFPKTVSYVADAHGFRVTGANNLPIAPADTLEVASARHAHFAALGH